MGQVGVDLGLYLGQSGIGDAGGLANSVLGGTMYAVPGVASSAFGTSALSPLSIQSAERLFDAKLNAMQTALTPLMLTPQEWAQWQDDQYRNLVAQPRVPIKNYVVAAVLSAFGEFTLTRQLALGLEPVSELDLLRSEPVWATVAERQDWSVALAWAAYCRFLATLLDRVTEHIRGY